MNQFLQIFKIKDFRKKVFAATLLFLSYFLFITNIADAAQINIKDDATGGDCFLIGVWNWDYKTCVLSTDLNDSIIIKNDGITLDGDNTRLSAIIREMA